MGDIFWVATTWLWRFVPETSGVPGPLQFSWSVFVLLTPRRCFLLHCNLWYNLTKLTCELFLFSTLADIPKIYICFCLGWLFINICIAPCTSSDAIRSISIIVLQWPINASSLLSISLFKLFGVLNILFQLVNYSFRDFTVFCYM
jgi:hypothetical protein